MAHRTIDRMPFLAFGLAVFGSMAVAQAPSLPVPPTMKQIMLDLIHPAANDILLTVYRGGPVKESDWATVRRSALALANAGNQLLALNKGSDWIKASKMLTDAGADAYKAAQAKDTQALAAGTANLDTSCTNCHQHYRPNVFPAQGGSN